MDGGVGTAARNILRDIATLELPLAFEEIGKFVLDVRPLDDAACVEEIRAAVFPQGVALPAAAVVAVFRDIPPETQEPDKVAFTVLPFRVRGFRLPRFFRRSLARVVRLKGSDDGKHLGKAMFFAGLDEHAPQPRVHRQARHLATIVR